MSFWPHTLGTASQHALGGMITNLTLMLNVCMVCDRQNAEDANALYGAFPSRIEIEVTSH